MVANRYRLEEELGRGGMGVVWRAVDLELGRQVTLKRALGEDAGQIRREARIGAGLLHSNVVTVFDTVTDGDAQWLVTEYLAARSLEELVDDGGRCPWPASGGSARSSPRRSRTCTPAVSSTATSSRATCW